MVDSPRPTAYYHSQNSEMEWSCLLFSVAVLILFQLSRSCTKEVCKHTYHHYLLAPVLRKRILITSIPRWSRCVKSYR